jgi:hypothetical protein
MEALEEVTAAAVTVGVEVTIMAEAAALVAMVEAISVVVAAPFLALQEELVVYLL